MSARKVDVLIEKIGDPGKFQVISYFCILGNMVMGLGIFLSMAFFAAKTKYHCTLAEGQSVADFVPIVTNSNNEKQWDGCHVYAGNNTTTTVPCRDGWTYYLEDNEATIISDFNLVCDDAYKSDLSSTIFFAGVMVGTLTLGSFADKWGRIPVIAILLLCCGGLNLAIFFAQSFVAFTILRFLLGFTLQGAQIATFVLGVELFQTKYRALASIFFGVGGAFGGGLLAFLAYLLKDWRYVQLGFTIMPFSQLILLWFVPESLRWLLLKKKFNRAEAVIKRVVIFNNLLFPYEEFNEIKESSAKEPDHPQQKAAHKAGFTQLMKNRILRNRTLILATTWFTVSATYYGLAFNISFLFGNKYLNFGISQVVDVSGVILVAWAVPRIGRRIPLMWSFLLCGVGNVISLITKVVKSDANGIKILGTVTALLGKGCAAACLMVLYTFTSELYPTVVRNISLGINTFWARVGGMAAPQIFLLGEYISEVVPYAIIGPLSLLSASLVFLLPETRNKALMDTIEHAGEFVNYSKTIVESETVLNLATMSTDDENIINTSDDDVIVESETVPNLAIIRADDENIINTSDDDVIVESETVPNLATIRADDEDIINTSDDVIVEPEPAIHHSTTTQITKPLLQTMTS